METVGVEPASSSVQARRSPKRASPQEFEPASRPFNGPRACRVTTSEASRRRPPLRSRVTCWCERRRLSAVTHDDALPRAELTAVLSVRTSRQSSSLPRPAGACARRSDLVDRDAPDRRSAVVRTVPPLTAATEVRTGGVEPPQPEATRLQRAELSCAQRPHERSAGGIRTHGLELMRLARTASPLPRRSGRLESNQRSPVPKTGGVAISPTASTWSPRSAGPLRGQLRTALRLIRGIEPRSTAVSERRLPSRPVVVVSGADRNPPRATFRSRDPASRPFAPGRRTRGISMRRRQGIAPCSTDSQPAGLATSLATQLAGRMSNPRRAAVGAWCSPLSYGEIALSTGIEPASPGRQPGRMSQTRPRACVSTPSGTRTRVSGVRDRRPRPSRRSGQSRLRRLGSNQRLPGNNRSSCR